MTPTKRSLDLLREEGYKVAIVEHWNHFAQIRQDLFGFIDLLAIKPGEVLAVQVTSVSNMSSRRNKIADHENVGPVRESGIRIELHGWAKGANGRWQVKREDLS